jgi:hypothetical protein
MKDIMMSETESSAAINSRLLEHRRRTNEQRNTIIPAHEAAVVSAKAAFDAGLLSADPAALVLLKSAIAAAQDGLETEQRRLDAMVRHTAEIESGEKAARVREQRPVFEAACRDYVAACVEFHEHLAGLPVAVQRATSAAAIINESRLIGTPLPFDIADLNPTNRHPHQQIPELAKLLMPAEAAANILAIKE